MSLHIEGRRWFERTNGNTYHSVRIFMNGVMIHHTPFTYGYGDQFLQTAIDWINSNGDKLGANWKYCLPIRYGTRELREKLQGSYSVIDVRRKKDL